MSEQKKISKDFYFGIITGIALMAILGLFYMNSQGSGNSNKITKVSSNPSAPTVAPTPSVPTPPTSGDIQIQPVSDDDWIKGDRNAKVSVIEFSDTECPFCKRFHPTMQQIVQDYDGEVNWVYRHFPLTSLHPKAPKEAEAAECAGELAGNDGFWAYIDRIFEITPSNNNLDASQLPQIAEDVGLNVDDFQECLNSGRYAQKVQDQYNQAVAAGGRGTPYSVIIVGDQKIPLSGAVPVSQVKATIDSLL